MLDCPLTGPSSPINPIALSCWARHFLWRHSTITPLPSVHTTPFRCPLCFNAGRLVSLTDGVSTTQLSLTIRLRPPWPRLLSIYIVFTYKKSSIKSGRVLCALQKKPRVTFKIKLGFLFARRVRPYRLLGAATYVFWKQNGRCYKHDSSYAILDLYFR